MAYFDIENAVKTLLLTDTTDFRSVDISQGNYDIIENGAPSHIVLVPGAVGPEQVGSCTLLRTWDVMIDIFIRYSVDNPWTTFQTVRANVMAKLDAYPTLNNPTTMVVQQLVSAGDVSEVFEKNGEGPFYLLQRLRLTVEEKSSLTTGEYA
jgi:hypothetical protein